MKTQASMQILHELESERNQKETLRAQFLSRGWLNTARRYGKGLDQIRGRIIAAQQKMTTLENPRVIANSLAIMIVFRLVLLIANLICVHRIAEHFGIGTLQNRYG